MTGTPKTANLDGNVDRIKLLSARDRQGVPAIKPVAVIVLAAIILGSAGCSKPTPDAAAQPPPVANDPLQAAFAVAFPSGAVVQDGRATLTYAARQLVPVSADVEALIAEGTAQDLGFSSKLKIIYLNHAAGGLTSVGKPGGWSIDGNPQGELPAWAINRTSGVPVLTAKVDGWDAGCHKSAVKVYRLDPQGVSRDKAASKEEIIQCQGEEPADDASNNQADASSETDSSAAQAAGARANWDAYYHQHPDQMPSDTSAATGNQQ